MNDTNNKATPRHLWVVGIAALLWNAMGALDYVMTQTRNESYMSNFTPQQLDYFYGFPSWLIALWAIAVWGGVLGAICLLLRKSIAVHVFLASLIAMLITTVYSYGIADGMQVVGDTVSLIFTAVIFIISLALYFYAKAQRDGNILH